MLFEKYNFSRCNLCPRRCGANRVVSTGFCGMGSELRISRAALHMWEEPCISGKFGSGTVFFVGCNLGCSYCQNYDISSCLNMGKEISVHRLRQICFELKDKGAHNINFVTPTHFAPLIAEAVIPIKKELSLPIVCNTGGYDNPEAIDYMCSFADIFLPDFKYGSQLAGRIFSRAENYTAVALEAVKLMVKHTGKPEFSSDGMLIRGTIVRHLVLPGNRKDSITVMDILGENFSPDEILVSVMSQYTPNKNAAGVMARRVTSFEYDSVVNRCAYYGFDGFTQDSQSASSYYTPPFDLTGV